MTQTNAIDMRDLRPAKGQERSRSFTLSRDLVDAEKRTVELAFSSDAPIERGWGTETLVHAREAVNFERFESGSNVMVDHDWRDVVGIIESWSIDADGKGRALVRFGKSARAEEIFQDVLDGIRKNVSVGYMVDEVQLDRQDEQKLEHYRVTKWTPFEISFVSVPADISVGVGRSHQVSGKPNDNTDTRTTEDKTMPKDDIEVIDNADFEKKLADATRNVEQDVAKRNVQILAIAEQFKHYDGVEKLAREAVTKQTKVEQFRASVMDKISSQKTITPEIGMDKKETRQYSVLRAIKAMVDKDWTGAELEKEAHEAVLKRHNKSEADEGGFYVPYEVQKRDLTATGGDTGDQLVGTDHLAGSFIDMLRNQSVTARMGATMLTGLRGNVQIPKQIGGTTMYWVAENGELTESDAQFTQIPMSPKTAGVYSEISRQLMLQSSPAADGLVLSDIAKSMALGVDKAVYAGSGTGAEVTGIKNSTGVGSVTGTTIDYAKVLAAQVQAATANALVAQSGYVTRPDVAALLMQREKASGTGQFLWKGSVLEGDLAGFSAFSSMQLDAGEMLFGDWSQVMVGEWGMLEIALNPYANFKAAVTGIRAIQSLDVAIRHPEAFTLISGIT